MGLSDDVSPVRRNAPRQARSKLVNPDVKLVSYGWDLWGGLAHQYRNGEYCDLDIRCGGEGTFAVVSCHRAVAASLSRMLFRALSESPAEEGGSTSSLHLPDVDFITLKSFIDSIYAFISDRGVTASQISIPASLADIFDMQGCDIYAATISSVLTVEDKAVKRRPTHAKKVPKESKRKKLQKYSKKKLKEPSEILPDIIKTDVEELPEMETKMVFFDKTELEETVSHCDGELEGVQVKADGNNIQMTCKGDIDTFIKAPFKLLAGVKQGDNRGTLRTLPLAWNSQAEGFDPGEQYLMSCQALKLVFGLSQMDVCFQNSVHVRLGSSRDGSVSTDIEEGSLGRLGKKFHKLIYNKKRKYATYSTEDLEKEVAREDIVELTKRSERRPQLMIELPEVALRMDSSLEVTDLEGVLFVYLLPNGTLEGHVLQVTENSLEKDAHDLNKVLLNVWSYVLREKGKRLPAMTALRIPFCETIARSYRDLMEPAVALRECSAYLANPESQKAMRTRTKDCPECGETFPFATFQHIQKFNAHAHTHRYADFTCDCEGVDPSDYMAKIDHVKLYHSNGKYAPCDNCGLVVSTADISKHICDPNGDPKREKNRRRQYGTLVRTASDSTRLSVPGRSGKSGSKNTLTTPEERKALVCSVCGTKAVDVQALSSHKWFTHADKKCKFCDAVLPGNKALQHHLKDMHDELVERGSFVCDQCGVQMENDWSLRRHKIERHLPESLKPYPCDECSKGFSSPSILLAHQVQVHIKDLRYECRYLCGARYNNVCSRYSHEISKHGNDFLKQDRRPRRKRKDDGTGRGSRAKAVKLELHKQT